jgi:hypothetical protein
VWTYLGATYGAGWNPITPGNMGATLPTTVNELAIWNNTTGTLLRERSPGTLTDGKTGAINTDAASLTVATRPNLTAKQIVDWIFLTAPNATVQNNFDSVRGIAELTPGSAVGLVNGVGGYVHVLAPMVGENPTSVALFGAGVVGVNNGRVWGFNTTVADCEYRDAVACAGAAGRQLYNEIDLSFSNTSSIGTGLQFAGNSVVQPNNATAVTLAYLDYGNQGTKARWNNFLYSLHGSTYQFAFVGALENGGNNIDSQPITFAAFNSSGAGMTGQQKFGSDGAMSFNVEVKSAGFVSHTDPDKNLRLGPNIDLAAGTSITSTNDAGDQLSPLEILASDFYVNTPVRLKSYTVATLPPCSSSTLAYAMTAVTDAVAPTYNGVLTGGGAVKVPVFCNGTAWVAH